MSLFLFALLGVAQPQASPAPIDAATVATAIQPRLPRRFSADVAMTGAMAEGDLLILRFEVSAAALAGATPDLVSARFSASFCGVPGGRELLDGPMRLRADARGPDGRIVQGAVLETCPGLPPSR